MTEAINSANAATSTLFLGQNGEWWDSSLILSLIFVALAAVAALVTTAGSIVSHKREAIAAEAVLERFKLETGKKISEADARTQEAQLALEKLRSFRTLSEDQTRDLINKMSAWASLPKSKQAQRVAIFSVSDTFESKQFADLLARVFGSDGAKWAVNRNPVTYGTSYSVVGIGLLIPPSSKRARAIADELSKTLTSYGLPTSVLETRDFGVQGDEDENSGLSSISLMVGEKPKE